MCEVHDLECLKAWADRLELRIIIMDVVKARLDLGWPYNYKALDVLSHMPVSELGPLTERLKALSDAPAWTEGATNLRLLAKPLLEKAMIETWRAEVKAEEEAAKAKQEAAAAMWGRMWSDHGMYPPARTNAQEGWSPYVAPRYPNWWP